MGDIEEMKAALSKMGTSDEELEVQVLMKIADTDKDGKISWKEFIAAVYPIPPISEDPLGDLNEHLGRARASPLAPPLVHAVISGEINRLPRLETPRKQGLEFSLIGVTEDV